MELKAYTQMGNVLYLKDLPNKKIEVVNYDENGECFHDIRITNINSNKDRSTIAEELIIMFEDILEENQLIQRYGPFKFTLFSSSTNQHWGLLRFCNSSVNESFSDKINESRRGLTYMNHKLAISMNKQGPKKLYDEPDQTDRVRALINNDSYWEMKMKIMERVSGWTTVFQQEAKAIEKDMQFLTVKDAMDRMDEFLKKVQSIDKVIQESNDLMKSLKDKEIVIGMEKNKLKVKEKELKSLEWSLLEREVNLAVRQKEIKKMSKDIDEKREINVSEREKACAEKEAWLRTLTEKARQLDEKPLEDENN